MDKYIFEKNKNCILIIDDDFINRELLKNMLSSQYTFEEALNGKEGLEQIHKHQDKLCAIILDVQMPIMNGLEMLKIIHEQEITEKIPTFIITAYGEDDIIETAYNLGVIDVITKPASPIVIQQRLNTVIELFNKRETLRETIKGQALLLSENEKAMNELHRGTIEALATAIEFRDIESGNHVNRIYGITKYMLLHTEMGSSYSDAEIENIARGAILHDVGKIAISDVILNKPGRLTKEEFEIMKNHTVSGAEILDRILRFHSHESNVYAYDIALHHHERWDGRGYPEGLKGDEISIASQVVSIADVYDALVSKRVYKAAFTADKAVDMIKNGECGVFNPFLVECFLQVEPAIRKWYEHDNEDEIHQQLSESDHRLNGGYNPHNTGKSTTAASMANSVMDVMLLMLAVQSAYDMIISVNLTQNSYYMIDYNRFQTHCAGSNGVFDDLIAAGANSIPLSHRNQFIELFNRANQLEMFEEGKTMLSLEHPQYGDDGKLHWVHTSVLLMKDGRTDDVLQITLSRYIDEAREQQEKTRKILSNALAISERANSTTSDMLSKISHGIRTPINSIIGMSTILTANADDKEKVAEYLDKITESSKSILEIINDILEVSKDSEADVSSEDLSSDSQPHTASDENSYVEFNGEKLLLVEDNEFNQEIAKTILEMKNLKVDVASNGQEALDKFLASAPGEYSAILMDIVMPVMDGHETTRRIRALQRDDAVSIPIYAMTANAFHDDVMETKLSGMNGHIAKPVDFDELARILQSDIIK